MHIWIHSYKSKNQLVPGTAILTSFWYYYADKNLISKWYKLAATCMHSTIGKEYKMICKKSQDLIKYDETIAHMQIECQRNNKIRTT